MMKPLLSLLATVAVCGHARAQTRIGQWRDHLPYRKAIAVAEATDDRVFCATRAGLFKYDPFSAEIDKYTKVNALNDVNISTIAWCAALQRLVVGYDNGNIDLVGDNDAVNLGDIRRSSLIGDKSINQVVFDGTTGYFSCGFGIVVADLSVPEILETWLIGPGGTQLAVNGICFLGDSVHAATNEGVYSALRSDPNLAAFTSWHKHTELPNPNGRFNALAAFNGKLFVNYRHPVLEEADTMYIQDGGWQRFSALYGRRNNSLAPTADGELLVIAHKFDIHEYDPAMVEVGFYYDYVGDFMQPVQALRSGNGWVWVADTDTGLRRTGSNLRVEPNGPSTVNAIKMDMANGGLYCATGGVATNWTNSFLKEGVQSLVNGYWYSTDKTTDALMASGANAFGGTVNDIMAVAVDPLDPTHAYAGSWDDGLIEIRDRHVTQIYNADNSSLLNESGSTEPKVNVAGLDHDIYRNLWITNANTNSCIAVKLASGGWKSFSPGAVLGGNTLVSDILASHINNLKWVIRPRGNGMLVFNDNGTIGNTDDDGYKVLNTFDGQGELPSMDVYSMVEDLDGEIWVGTGKGVAVFYAPDAVFGGGDFDCQQILIEQDGNIQILLETESVTAMAVDGANRKWLGTSSSGVYLVSADGTEQILHFTTANSPLPSNTITAIAIDGLTGEVFFGTDQGTMSYRNDATEGALSATCASVFPNPVQPGYTGPIAITGLMRDSQVSITDVAGNLVYRTTSNGGEAIWPGTDMEGERVSTGVYLALAVDPTGASKCNTRILVVR